MHLDATQDNAISCLKDLTPFLFATLFQILTQEIVLSPKAHLGAVQILRNPSSFLNPPQDCG